MSNGYKINLSASTVVSNYFLSTKWKENRIELSAYRSLNIIFDNRLLQFGPCNTKWVQGVMLYCYCEIPSNFIYFFLFEQSLSVLFFKNQDLISIKTFITVAKNDIDPWIHDLNWKRVFYISLKEEFPMKFYFHFTSSLSNFEMYFQSFHKICINTSHNDDLMTSILKKKLNRHRLFLKLV